MSHEHVVRELALVRKDELESAHTIEPVNGAANFLADLTVGQWAVVTAAPKNIMMLEWGWSPNADDRRLRRECIDWKTFSRRISDRSTPTRGGSL